jgi:hypothetical protein
MAKLTAKRRNALPSKDFAGPGRSYPVDTRNRAVNAKGRAKEQWETGRLSTAEYKKIVAKANDRLH